MVFFAMTSPGADNDSSPQSTKELDVDVLDVPPKLWDKFTAASRSPENPSVGSAAPASVRPAAAAGLDRELLARPMAQRSEPQDDELYDPETKDSPAVQRCGA